jgi:hypothetical protein
MVTQRYEAVFVVRLWREASSPPADAWRGSVTAASGERFHFTRFEDLCAFFEGGLCAAGDAGHQGGAALGAGGQMSSGP